MTTDYPCNMSKFLRKKGFTRLGGGGFSSVYAHPKSDRVIKVGHNDNWLGYILWATENGYAGNFAPKVYSYHIVKDDLGNFTAYFAVVERILGTTRWASGTSAYAHGNNFTTAFDGRLDGEGNLLPTTEAAYPGLKKFGDALTQWAHSKHHWLDLNPGNIMFRADGSICITDPVTGDIDQTIPKRMREPEMEALSYIAEIAS